MFVNEVTVGNRLVFGDPSHSQRPASPLPMSLKGERRDQGNHYALSSSGRSDLNQARRAMARPESA